MAKTPNNDVRRQTSFSKEELRQLEKITKEAYEKNYRSVGENVSYTCGLEALVKKIRRVVRTNER